MEMCWVGSSGIFCFASWQTCTFVQAHSLLIPGDRCWFTVLQITALACVQQQHGWASGTGCIPYDCCDTSECLFSWHWVGGGVELDIAQEWWMWLCDGNPSVLCVCELLLAGAWAPSVCCSHWMGSGLEERTELWDIALSNQNRDAVLVTDPWLIVWITRYLSHQLA